MTSFSSKPNLSLTIAAAIGGIMGADYTWELLGYKKRPKRGAFFNRFVSPAKLSKEQAVYRELMIACLDIAIRCLEKSTIPPEGRARALAGIIDTLIMPSEGNYMNEMFGFRSSNELSDWIFSTLAIFATTPDKDRVAFLMKRFNDALGGISEREFVGIAKLDVDGPFQSLRSKINSDFLINPNMGGLPCYHYFDSATRLLSLYNKNS